jgi:hypothetical protein
MTHKLGPTCEINSSRKDSDIGRRSQVDSNCTLMMCQKVVSCLWLVAWEYVVVCRVFSEHTANSSGVMYHLVAIDMPAYLDKRVA